MIKLKIILLSLLYFIVFTYQGYTEENVTRSFPAKNQILCPQYMGSKDVNCKELSDEGILPIEELIKNSNIIITGKVISTEIDFPVILGKNEDYSYVSHRFSKCTIEIIEVLKGDNNIKTVLLAMPPWISFGTGLTPWRGPIFTEGLEGIWFLTKTPQNVPINNLKNVLKLGDYYFADTLQRYKKYDKELINKIKYSMRE